jgi:hypothetical protein
MTMTEKPVQRRYVLDARALIAHERNNPKVGALLKVAARQRIESGTTDVADAHVVVLAGRLRASVITSDPDDISKLNAELPLIRV